MWILLALAFTTQEEAFRHLKAREYGEALVAFEEVLTRAPDEPAGHYGRGLALAGLLRYRDAVAAFEGAVELAPDHAASWTELVVLYGQLGDSDAARRAFENLGVPEPAQRVRVARALRKAGLNEEARACLPAPYTAEAHGELALLSVAEGHCEDAVTHFEAADASAQLQLEHGRCLESLGREAAAIARYRAALASEPALRPARFRLGNLLLRSGEREEAMALLEGYETYRQWERRTKLLLTMVTSGTLTAHDEREKTLELIDLYLQGGRLDEADALLGSGRAEYPEDASFRLARVRWLLASGQGEGARQMLDELVAEPEPPVDALWLSARLELNDGQTVASIENYERFVARVATPPAVLLKELATAYAIQGDAASSVAFFERAIAADPALADARADLGLLLESLGKTSEAEQQYRSALRVDPRLVAAQQGLGSLLLEKGELETAEELFRQSVELSPKEPHLRRNLALALSRLGRDDEAREQLSIARELEK